MSLSSRSGMVQPSVELTCQRVSGSRFWRIAVFRVQNSKKTFLLRIHGLIHPSFPRIRVFLLAIEIYAERLTARK